MTIAVAFPTATGLVRVSDGETVPIDVTRRRPSRQLLLQGRSQADSTVLMHDPDARGGMLHWAFQRLRDGSMNELVPYKRPHPPRGQEHHYHFLVYDGLLKVPKIRQPFDPQVIGARPEDAYFKTSR